MEKTIEEAYFKAFQQLADNCISYILQKEWKKNIPVELRPTLELTLLRHCNSIEELKKTIPSDFEQFQKANKPSDVSKEIESNIDSITDPKERLKYLFSLLTPFKEICRVIHPTEHKPKEKADKSGYSWERLERSRQSAFEGIKDLKYSVLSKIAERNKYYELPYIYTPFKINTIEYYLRSMLVNMNDYANRLYAVLVQRGIDLKDLQEKAGIYLKGNWVADDIANYVGGKELAKYYINKLPTAMLNDEQAANVQQSNDEQPTIKTIPLAAQQDIMTDRAKKYFEKAIEAGYMEKAGSGYKWTFPISKGAKAALCYFIMKVYSPNPTDPKTIHFKALGELFGVKRLDSATGAMLNAKSPQEWRGDIDSLFND